MNISHLFDLITIFIIFIIFSFIIIGAYTKIMYGYSLIELLSELSKEYHNFKEHHENEESPPNTINNTIILVQTSELKPKKHKKHKKK